MNEERMICESLTDLELAHVTGGTKKRPPAPVSPETVGCAVGGAAGTAAGGGPWGAAGGCIVGGMVANQAAEAYRRDRAGEKPEKKPYNPYAGGSGGVYGNM